MPEVRNFCEGDIVLVASRSGDYEAEVGGFWPDGRLTVRPLPGQRMNANPLTVSERYVLKVVKREKSELVTVPRWALEMVLCHDISDIEWSGDGLKSDRLLAAVNELEAAAAEDEIKADE